MVQKKFLFVLLQVFFLTNAYGQSHSSATTSKKVESESKKTKKYKKTINKGPDLRFSNKTITPEKLNSEKPKAEPTPTSTAQPKATPVPTVQPEVTPVPTSKPEDTQPEVDNKQPANNTNTDSTSETQTDE